MLTACSQLVAPVVTALLTVVGRLQIASPHRRPGVLDLRHRDLGHPTTARHSRCVVLFSLSLSLFSFLPCSYSNFENNNKKQQTISTTTTTTTTRASPSCRTARACRSTRASSARSPPEGTSAPSWLVLRSLRATLTQDRDKRNCTKPFLGEQLIYFEPCWDRARHSCSGRGRGRGRGR